MKIYLFEISVFSNKKTFLKLMQGFIFNNALFLQVKEYSIFCDGNPVKLILTFSD